jgi:thioredoxin-related protein
MKIRRKILQDIILIAILAIGINVPILVIKHYQDLNRLKFFEGSWEEALAAANTENKPIFLEIYKNWCLPCQLLKNQSYSRKEVGDFFNEQFINISFNRKIDPETKIGIAVDVKDFPTLYILNTSGEPVIHTEGRLKPKDLLRFGHAGIELLKNEGGYCQEL